MKTAASLLSVFLFAALPANAAQLYRWVDGKGNVEWRDTPPPAAAKKVEQRAVSPGQAATSDQPYSVQLAAKNFPVTLWVTECGEGCTRAREHLAKRGVPHAVKNPQADFESFKKLTGGTEVPVLQVGSNRVRGYQEAAYDDALDFAGYPKTALAPTKLQPIPPVPKPAAEAQPADAAAKPAPGTPATQAPAAK